jgi:hypothetical protein
VALCLAAMAGGAALRLFGLLPGVTEANVRRIQPGMTEPEVKAILGEPPWAISGDWGRLQRWIGSGLVVHVRFTREGVVQTVTTAPLSRQP